MTVWKFLGTSFEGQRFEVAGLDVWAHEWIRQNGKKARVTDPLYGAVFTFQVYEVAAGSTHAVFAAGEFSNGVFGFYAPAADKAAR